MKFVGRMGGDANIRRTAEPRFDYAPSGDFDVGSISSHLMRS